MAPVAEPRVQLPVDSWVATRDTLHMWTQIVGKTRLALAPMVGSTGGSGRHNSAARWWSTPATAAGVSSHAAASEATRPRSCSRRGSP